MTDEDLKTLETAGQITLVLKHGTDRERESLLDCIEEVCGLDERLRLQAWVEDGMANA